MTRPTHTMIIENANSSGQGYCAAHAQCVPHDRLVEFGWLYSHTTPIVHHGGTDSERYYYSHTYVSAVNSEYRCSYYHGDGIIRFSKGGSGQCHRVPFYKLSKYLDYKNKWILKRS
jgi:hypothetical protein